MILHRVSAEVLELEVPRRDPELLRLLSVVGVPPDYVDTVFVTITFSGIDEEMLYDKFSKEAHAQLIERAAQSSLPF